MFDDYTYRLEMLLVDVLNVALLVEHKHWGRQGASLEWIILMVKTAFQLCFQQAELLMTMYLHNYTFKNEILYESFSGQI